MTRAQTHRSLACLLALGAVASGFAQTLTGNYEFFGRQNDARSEAMGLADVALVGDVRSMTYSPASLIDLEGLDLYVHQASPWYLLEKSTFQRAAMAYRLGERFAFGVGYDRSQLKSDLLSFGDMIDPRRGFVYQTEGAAERLSATLAFKVAQGFSIGAGVANIPLSDGGDGLVYGNFGALGAWRLKSEGLVQHSIRAAIGVQNIGFTTESYTYVQSGVEHEWDVEMPVVSRIGTAYRMVLNKGWVHDSLPSIAFTAEIQFDDDLTQRYRNAVRCGAEVELLGCLAIRCGWYNETVDDLGHPDVNKGAIGGVTYGFGLTLPIGRLTGVPLTVSCDYTSLPQVSYRNDELNPLTDAPWENFNSFGLRLNYGIGRLVKPKVRT